MSRINYFPFFYRFWKLTFYSEFTGYALSIQLLLLFSFIVHIRVPIFRSTRAYTNLAGNSAKVVIVDLDRASVKAVDVSQLYIIWHSVNGRYNFSRSKYVDIRVVHVVTFQSVSWEDWLLLIIFGRFANFLQFNP